MQGTQGTSIHQSAWNSLRTLFDGRFDRTMLFCGPRKGGGRDLSSFPIEATKFHEELPREDNLHARDARVVNRHSADDTSRPPEDMSPRVHFTSPRGHSTSPRGHVPQRTLYVPQRTCPPEDTPRPPEDMSPRGTPKCPCPNRD